MRHAAEEAEFDQPALFARQRRKRVPHALRVEAGEHVVVQRALQRQVGGKLGLRVHGA